MCCLWWQSDDGPASPSPPKEKDDHKTKNLNLLLSRLKEKMATLQGEYERQTKELADLRAAHLKLQNAHSNLQAKSKNKEEELNAKLTLTVQTAARDLEQLSAKMKAQESDMQRSASVMKSAMQEELCEMQSKLNESQNALLISQATLEADRTRLGQQLAATTADLRESRALQEEGINALRTEREDRMRATYSAQDKTRECDGHIFRAKRLDERILELSDHLVLVKQNLVRSEQQSETWRHKSIALAAMRLETKKRLKHYQMLLKYAAIGTWASGFRMKKLLLSVYNKLCTLCAEAITNDGGERLIAHSPAAAIAAANMEADAVSASHNSSRRNSGATTAAATTHNTADSESHTNGPAPASAQPPTTHVRPHTSPAKAAAVFPAASPSTSIAGIVLSGALPGSNMSTLPRYSIGTAALTDREWEIHVSDLAHPVDLAGPLGAKLSNLELLQAVEERLSILGPVVGELRSEVLSSRSTSEGMFQRTLQLSRKNMSVCARYEREKSRTDSLREKLAIAQREVKKLKRVEFMYCRLTEKGTNGAPSAAAIAALEREENREALAQGLSSAGGSRSAARRRRKRNLSDQDSIPHAHDGRHGGGVGLDPYEEKELSSSMMMAAAAAALEADQFLTDSDDEAHDRDDEMTGGTISTREQQQSAAAGVAARRLAAAKAAQPASAQRTRSLPNNDPQHPPLPSGNSALQWEARKSRPAGSKEVLLPNAASLSASGQSTPSGGQSKSPSRPAPPASARLPAATVAARSNANANPATAAWNLGAVAATPSPPPTAASANAGYRASKSSGGSRTTPSTAHILSRGGAGGDELRGHEPELFSATAPSPLHQHEYANSIAARSSMLAGPAAAPMPKRSRNPYAVSVRNPRTTQSHKSAASSARPLSAPRRQPHAPANAATPQTQAQQPSTSRVATGSTPGGGRIHTLNPITAPITTASILQAAAEAD